MPLSRLGRLPVFHTLSEARLQWLERSLEEMQLQANQPVYRTGDACDGLYVVRRGAVSVRTERPGEAVGQGFHRGVGDLFGEAEVTDRMPREMTARAVCRATVLRIPLARMTELLAEEPSMTILLRGLATQRRMAHARHLLASSTRKEVRIWLDREVELDLGAGRRFTALLEDLSFGGACFASVPDSWQVGNPVIFTLGVEGHPNLLQARGTVRWRDEAQAGIAFEAGPLFRKQVDEALRVLSPLAAA